jgi:hypothetical protein
MEELVNDQTQEEALTQELQNDLLEALSDAVSDAEGDWHPIARYLIKHLATRGLTIVRETPNA